MRILTKPTGDKSMCDNDFDGFDDEGEELEGVDDDFGPPSINAVPNHDDCQKGIDWDDFTLGMGLGQELAYGERRKRRRDQDDCI